MKADSEHQQDRPEQNPATKTSDPARFRIYDFVIIGAVFAAILFFGIYFQQAWIRTIPCLVTLVVLMLSAHANRWGYLLGALNSVLYAIGYFQLKVYGQVASALLVSVPIQILTVINWSKKTVGKQVSIKSMSAKYRGIGSAMVVAAWLLSWLILWLLDDFNAPLSGATFVIGLSASLLAMAAYVESCYLNVLNYLITTVLNVLLMLESWANLTYLLIGLFGLFQSVRSCFIWMGLYRMQKAPLAKTQSGQTNTTGEETKDDAGSSV